jgi:hypothetical protein
VIRVWWDVVKRLLRGFPKKSSHPVAREGDTFSARERTETRRARSSRLSHETREIGMFGCVQRVAWPTSGLEKKKGMRQEEEWADRRYSCSVCQKSRGLL